MRIFFFLYKNLSKNPQASSQPILLLKKAKKRDQGYFKSPEGKKPPQTNHKTKQEAKRSVFFFFLPQFIVSGQLHCALVKGEENGALQSLTAMPS